MTKGDLRSALPGEMWAYRKRAIDRLSQVQVIRHGKRHPPRTLVRFIADEFEGRQEWIPPARLKVLWSDAGEFEECERRWAEIRAVGIDDDDSRWDAADVIFTELIDRNDARLEYRQGGACRVSNPVRLLASLGLASDALSHPASFVEFGDLVAPWPITETIITTAARARPAPLLEYARREEAQARRAAVYGRHLSGRANNYIKPEICIETDAEYTHPVLAHLRQYCGSAATSGFDEIAYLRLEIRRVHAVAVEATDALRAAGQVKMADDFSGALTIESNQVGPV